MKHLNAMNTILTTKEKFAMTEKIIVRREPAKNGSRYIMFFPETAYFGNMMMECFCSADNMGNYCHSTASKPYYLECTPVGYTDIDVVKFVTDYVKYVRTLPDMQDYTIKMVKRISRK